MYIEIPDNLFTIEENKQYTVLELIQKLIIPKIEELDDKIEGLDVEGIELRITTLEGDVQTINLNIEELQQDITDVVTQIGNIVGLEKITTATIDGSETVTYFNNLARFSGNLICTKTGGGYVNIPITMVERITGENGINVDANEDDNGIVIRLDSDIISDISRALKTPLTMPTETELVGIGADNAQKRITLGNNLSIDENNVLNAEGGGGVMPNQLVQSIPILPFNGLRTNANVKFYLDTLTGSYQINEWRSSSGSQSTYTETTSFIVNGYKFYCYATTGSIIIKNLNAKPSGAYAYYTIDKNTKQITQRLSPAGSDGSTGLVISNGTHYYIYGIEKLSPAGTWLFNENPTASYEEYPHTIDVRFTCDGVDYMGIVCKGIMGVFSAMDFVPMSGAAVQVWATGTWADNKYKTITVLDSENDDAYTFLSGSATKQ